ncbi:MAG: RidA family protein [Lentisphaeria bacterium]|nr:RidA family protein [Lentisphaeria bacterium]MBQ8755333.1 RidA family protein [Lentisphaeria bacterium]MBQ9775639.1 RidA family protein [Lentisphaeria bacterium]
MKKEIISTSNAPAAVGPYSQAVKVGDMLYTSGQIALDPATGVLAPAEIKAQSEQVMKNLAAVLEAAGYTFDEVVKTTCFLSDMSYFAEFNAVYEKYFISKPARSCVAAAALPKGALVEVELIACH